MRSAAGATWFGHPRGLSTLFFTEMWERFSYYGMRAILLLFMTAPVTSGGMGWDAAKAAPIYGLYTSMVYFTALPGGWIADQFLGQRYAVLLGGIVIALGHVSLALHGLGFFYLGLGLIVLGTGLLKPNISAMVGQLYSSEDKRRDAGFSIFYMGINIGAFAAPLIIGYLAQHESFRSFLRDRGLRPEDSWHFGFGAAAVGMTLGLIQYVAGRRHLGQVGLQASGRGDSRAHRRQQRNLWIGIAATLGIVALGLTAGTSVDDVAKAMPIVLAVLPFPYFAWLLLQKGWTAVEKRRIVTIPLFFLFATLFWSAFEQAGSSLNLFADRLTDCSLFGRGFPSSWFQSVNSAFLVLLAPVFAALWLRLGAREPSSPGKFAWGLCFVGLGFLVMVGAALASGPQGALVGPQWLTGVYLLHTIGELCLSPVGLSTMTKLAPARVTGQMLGVWFMATSLGNSIGGQVAGLFEKLPLPQLFGAVTAVTLGFALVAMAMVRPMRKLMSGVH
jgi:POT family proton-dependent oligopeptide transporter